MRSLKRRGSNCSARRGGGGGVAEGASRAKNATVYIAIATRVQNAEKID